MSCWIPVPSGAAIMMSTFSSTELPKAIVPLGGGGAVGLGDSLGSAVGSGVGLSAIGVAVATTARDGLAVGAGPPRRPPATITPASRTKAIAPTRMIGPIGRSVRFETGAGLTTSVFAGLSSSPQRRQKTRSRSLTRPQLRQTISPGPGGGLGSGVGWGVGSGGGSGASGVGIGGWGVDPAVVGVSSVVSPVHSRNEPHEPQNRAPASLSNPQTLQVIKPFPPRVRGPAGGAGP